MWESSLAYKQGRCQMRFIGTLGCQRPVWHAILHCLRAQAVRHAPLMGRLAGGGANTRSVKRRKGRPVGLRSNSATVMPARPSVTSIMTRGIINVTAALEKCGLALAARMSAGGQARRRRRWVDYALRPANVGISCHRVLRARGATRASALASMLPRRCWCWCVWIVGQQMTRCCFDLNRIKHRAPRSMGAG